MKEQKGITLIALVVTIVVLLILAAISINIAFGDNGIFKQAQMAAGSTANAIDYESNTLGQQMAEFIENSVGSIGTTNPDPEPTETYYLVDKVEVGDYVAYDAGTWAETVAKPNAATGNVSFGGYTAGTNKGTSVNQDWSGSNMSNGWRVLDVDNSSRTVTLISAGTPCGMYHYSETSRSEWNSTCTAMDTFCNENFVNTTYALSARCVTRTDLNSLSSGSDLRKIGSYYYLPPDYKMSSDQTPIVMAYFCDSSGAIDSNYIGAGYALGIRPVVTLKADVKTNATADTEFLGQTCWALK